LLLTTMMEIGDTLWRVLAPVRMEMDMPNNDYLRQTLEHYRQQRQAQIEEIRKTEALIAHFEKELGEPASVEPSPTVGIDFVNLAVDLRSPEPRTVDIRPDEFYGMTQTQAAKAYLQRVKRAVSIDQIVEALRNGGAQLGGAEPKKTLYVSLARNPERQFVIPREGYFGLREFYPTLPKAVSKPKNHKKKKIRRGQHKAVPKKTVNHPAAKNSGEVKAAVCKVFSAGRTHTMEEVLESVNRELGRKVAKVGIAATLRGKEFVKEGNSYKRAN
jgi:hypothetical protein